MVVRRRLGIVLAVVVVAFGALTALLFVRPSSDRVPASADAVALLSGGSGDRLPRAVGLVTEGVASVLVIPNGLDPKWPDANRLCTGEHDFEVICPQPEPDTTRGEAAALEHLAAELGWRRIVVVTSRYHLTRAELLLDRCVPAAEVRIVSSKPAGGPLRWTGWVAHEWLGLVDTVLFDRGC